VRDQRMIGDQRLHGR